MLLSRNHHLNKQLENLFKTLEADKTTLLHTLSAIPADRLNHNPKPGEWSINEILMHLLTSEQMTLTYLKKKSQALDGLGNSGILEALKMVVLTISQRLPILRYQAPKALLANTPQPVELSELRVQWDFSRAELKNFLENFHEKDLRKLVYRHPVAGRFNIVQCLMFQHEHFRHHLPQINRLH